MAVVIDFVKETPVITALSSAQKRLIRMLLYFDIFHYPLNQAELNLCTESEDELVQALNELVELNLIQQEGPYYFLSGKNYTKRIRQTTLSETYFPKAISYGKLIANFPFVRGVYVSGSLSKDWADESTDVDYFIVTTPNRLWICRMILILFKKTILLNSRKYFCLNYFIDTNSLEIEEKNIFTATEIVFMKPIVYGELFNDFIQSNGWVNRFYKKHHLGSTIPTIQRQNNIIKRLVEVLLRGRLGEEIDCWSMKRTLQYWKKKFPAMEAPDFEINFKTNRKISKHHPGGFQKRVMTELESKVAEFESHRGISLS